MENDMANEIQERIEGQIYLEPKERDILLSVINQVQIPIGAPEHDILLEIREKIRSA